MGKNNMQLTFNEWWKLYHEEQAIRTLRQFRHAIEKELIKNYVRIKPANK